MPIKSQQSEKYTFFLTFFALFNPAFGVQPLLVYAAIPEPSASAVLALGLAALSFVRRRRMS